MKVSRAGSAAFAALILLLSGIALALGLTTPQHRGALFWQVSAGFALQAAAALALLVRLVALQVARATNRGTQSPAQD